MNDQKLRGLLVEVYRGKFESTNGGVSSRCDTFLLVGEGVAEVFEESEDLPVLKLMTRCFGDGSIYKYAIPLTDKKTWFMFGGNFIYANDSRFPCDYPIKIHDRVE